MPLDEDALNTLKLDRDAARRATHRRARPWLLAGLLAAGLLLALLFYLLLRTPPLSVETAPARAAEAGAGNAAGAAILSASGYVVARRVATVSSRITGQLVEVNVEEGLRVEEGQVLARLDDTIARAELSLAESRLATARRAEEETRVRLEDARRTLERYRKLHAEGLVSQATLDTAVAEVQALEARLAVARGEAETAARNLELSRRSLELTVVRAPFAGVVTTKNAQPGEIVSPVSAGGGFTRTGIATIVDMDSLEIEVDVNESYINRVREGQPVEAVLDAWPDWRIPARVLSIVPTADRQKATVKVRIAFDELDPRILPEMGVQVRFLEAAEAARATPARRQVWIPAQALQVLDGREYVYVVEEGLARRRAVETGVRRGNEVSVSAGLAGGEQVIVSADGELSDGASVQRKE